MLSAAQTASDRASECYAQLERKAEQYDQLGKLTIQLQPESSL
jgi:hypothetical protein